MMLICLLLDRPLLWDSRRHCYALPWGHQRRGE